MNLSNVPPLPDELKAVVARFTTISNKIINELLLDGLSREEAIDQATDAILVNPGIEDSAAIEFLRAATNESFPFCSHTIQIRDALLFLLKDGKSMLEAIGLLTMRLESAPSIRRAGSRKRP